MGGVENRRVTRSSTRSSMKVTKDDLCQKISKNIEEHHLLSSKLDKNMVKLRSVIGLAMLKKRTSAKKRRILLQEFDWFRKKTLQIVSTFARKNVKEYEKFLEMAQKGDYKKVHHAAFRLFQYLDDSIDISQRRYERLHLAFDETIYSEDLMCWMWGVTHMQTIKNAYTILGKLRKSLWCKIFCIFYLFIFYFFR